MKPPAQAALACLLLTSTAAGIAQQATFSVAVDVVRLDALVTDGGRLVRGLGLADFEVIDNKFPSSSTWCRSSAPRCASRWPST